MACEFVVLRRVLSLNTFLQIFDNVPWEDGSKFHYMAPPKSRTKKRSRESIEETESETSSDEDFQEHFLEYKPRQTEDWRCRLYWDFLTSLPPAGFGWRHQSSEVAMQRDGWQHAGCFDFNQTSLNKDIWPQVVGPGVLYLPQRIKSSDYHLRHLITAQEATLIQSLGRQVTNAISTDAFPSQ
jgi:hypothetical protein